MNQKLIAIIILCTIVFSASLVNADEKETAFTQEVFMNQEPDPAKPGEYVELRWKVTKYGENQIENLMFMIEPEYPFFLDPGKDAIKEVGTWKGFSSDRNFYTLHYKLRVDKDAVEEDYEITLKKKHGDNDWSSQDYTIRVEEAKEPNLVIGDITSSPQKLQADIDEAELNIELSNIGDESVENFKAELKLPKGFTPAYSYSDSVILGTIDNGQSKTAQFFIDIAEGVKKGVHPATIVVRYKKSDDDDNQYIRQNMPINITLKPKPSFEITDQKVEPESITRGTTAKISLQVKNSGGKEADSVSVHAFKDSSQPFEITEKSDYIGKLEENEQGQAIIELNVEDDAEKKTHIIDIEIRAIDDDEVIVEEKQVKITVNGEKNKGASPVMGISIIAGIVVIGIGAFYFFRRG